MESPTGLPRRRSLEGLLTLTVVLPAMSPPLLFPDVFHRQTSMSLTARCPHHRFFNCPLRMQQELRFLSPPTPRSKISTSPRRPLAVSPQTVSRSTLRESSTPPPPPPSRRDSRT